MTVACSNVERFDWQGMSVKIVRGSLCFVIPPIRHSSVVRRYLAEDAHQMSARMECKLLIANVNQHELTDGVVDDLIQVVSRWTCSKMCKPGRNGTQALVQSCLCQSPFKFASTASADLFNPCENGRLVKLLERGFGRHGGLS